MAKVMPPADRRGRHGRYPLSQTTRKRLLAQLLTAAESGDPRATAELVWLSMRAEALPISPTGRAR
jgi:hypothetical protein